MQFKTLMLTYRALAEPFTVKHLTTSVNCYTYMLPVGHLGLLIWQFLALDSVQEMTKHLIWKAFPQRGLQRLSLASSIELVPQQLFMFVSGCLYYCKYFSSMKHFVRSAVKLIELSLIL